LDVGTKSILLAAKSSSEQRQRNYTINVNFTEENSKKKEEILLKKENTTTNITVKKTANSMKNDTD